MSITTSTWSQLAIFRNVQREGVQSWNDSGNKGPYWWGWEALLQYNKNMEREHIGFLNETRSQCCLCSILPSQCYLCNILLWFEEIMYSRFYNKMTESPWKTPDNCPLIIPLSILLWNKTHQSFYYFAIHIQGYWMG